MSTHKIICGHVIPALKSLPDEHVDMLMTSVPYWGLYTIRSFYLIMGEERNKQGQFIKGYTWREPKPYWDKEWLYTEYVEKDKSAKQIADEQGCDENNILYFLKKHGIKAKTITEIRARKHWGSKGEANGMYGRIGEESPHWKGGITPERQTFYTSREWAEACLFVWNRDNATCQRCGKKKTNTDEEFHIHRIISFSQKELRAEPNNLILLCRNCHRWVHSRKNKKKEFLGGDEYSNA